MGQESPGGKAEGLVWKEVCVSLPSVPSCSPTCSLWNSGRVLERVSLFLAPLPFPAREMEHGKR